MIAYVQLLPVIKVHTALYIVYCCILSCGFVLGSRAQVRRIIVSKTLELSPIYSIIWKITCP